VVVIDLLRIHHCSGPWGNNTHCFNNKGSHTLKTGKYYQDSDNEDRSVAIAVWLRACVVTCVCPIIHVLNAVMCGTAPYRSPAHLKTLNHNAACRFISPGISANQLIRVPGQGAGPDWPLFAQGLTIGSMWYDAGTNGSWAVSPRRHSSALTHSFH
jgi:hypothetical protein